MTRSLNLIALLCLAGGAYLALGVIGSAPSPLEKMPGSWPTNEETREFVARPAIAFMVAAMVIGALTLFLRSNTSSSLVSNLLTGAAVFVVFLLLVYGCSNFAESYLEQIFDPFIGDDAMERWGVNLRR